LVQAIRLDPAAWTRDAAGAHRPHDVADRPVHVLVPVRVVR
jgi:hypothetical protein